jgi:transposase
MRDELGAIVADEDFMHLFPERGQPAAAPWRLALVTLFQFAEDLSDRQAADAVRARIDWKYALALDLTSPGFDHTVLSEFRSRLLDGEATPLLLDRLLDQARQCGLLKASGRQRTDSTHVLAAVRALNRLELVRETMRHALDTLAVEAPDWLRAQARPEWVERYHRRSDEYQLPKGKTARQALADQIGADGFTLLLALREPEAPAGLVAVPAADMLRRIWIQNFLQTDRGARFRTTADGLPTSAQFLSSPHDPDAHLGKKGSTCWVGYKVALTETCEDAAPNLITHVETVAAPIADGEMTPRIHQALKEKRLLPTVHLTDTGFLDAELLVDSRADYGVELLGPTRAIPRWRGRAAAGFGVADFAIDWEGERAICPAGHASVEWRPRVDKRGAPSVYIRFSKADCGPCPNRAQCVLSTENPPRRSLSVRPREQHEALQQRRQLEVTPEYARAYARRAGIEASLSQGVRRCGLRRSRYVGLARTHLGHVLTAAALNFVRLAEWLAGTPRARTRRAPFATLMGWTAVAVAM